MVQALKQSIQDAERVIIGIGDELAVDFEALSLDTSLDFVKKEYEKARLLANCETLIQDEAYGKLKEMLAGKDYYIVSLNMDEALMRTFERTDNIVTPCGGHYLLQCSDACCKDLYEAKKIPGYPFSLEDLPECPACHKPMVYNNLYAEHYLEEGYLGDWNHYQNWLQTTVNKKLCILELGCSMKFPTIVRFAFDKLAFYNKKSVFYRVHETLWQHAEGTEDRGVSIKENALSFLCKC